MDMDARPRPSPSRPVRSTKTLLGINAATTILDVVVDGRAPVKALIREMQRDPLRPAQILHLDLYEVRTDEQITLEVPIHLVGIPDGVRNFGGVLDHSLREVEIEVLPADIPERVELDVTALTIGHSVFVRDIQIPKARILNDPDTPVATVVAPRTEEAPAVVEEPTWRSRSSSGSRRLRRRAKARAKPSPRPDPARHRWAGQPGPGVRPTPGTTPGFGWRTTWPSAGSSEHSGARSDARQARGNLGGARRSAC